MLGGHAAITFLDPAGPRSERDKVMGLSALSVGYGREVGIIMIIYIMAFAYAACSPIILPFALCYFTSAWVRATAFLKCW